MKRLVSLSLTLCICLCLLIGTESRALAYVDPGSGLLALQSGASMLAAAAYFMRRRIAAFFSKKPSAAAPMPVTSVKSESRKAA